jgi:WD40 repeat protein
MNIRNLVIALTLVFCGIAAPDTWPAKHKEVAANDEPKTDSPAVAKDEPTLAPPPRLAGVAAQPESSGNVFALAAAFKPDGPLPKLPPLPPPEKRPILSLDPGGHTAIVKHVLFTPDSKRVITVSEDKSVRIWDLSTNQLESTIWLPAGPDTEGQLHAASISSDGKWLAVAGHAINRGKSGFPFYILSVETGELVRMTTGVADTIYSLDFSPDGKRLAIGTAAGSLEVFDLTGKGWVYRTRAHTQLVSQVRFNPKGGEVATVSYDRDVKIWSLANNNPVAQIKLPDKVPNTIDWSSDGETLAVGCTSGEILLYDRTGKLTKTVPPALENGKDPIRITRLRFLPDGKHIVCGGVLSLGWAVLTNIETGKQTVTIEHSNTVMAVDRSVDGKLAASVGGLNNELVVWNTTDGAVLCRFETPSRTIWAVGWSKDGKSVAWGTNNRGVKGFKPLEQTFRFDDLLPGARPDPENYLRNIHEDGPISIKINSFSQFSVFENGKLLYRHDNSKKIMSVSLLPGKGILVGGTYTMYLLETRTGKLIRTYRGDLGQTNAVAPSPDGRFFVTGSTDRVVRVWSPGKVEPVLSLFTVGHEWVAWTPEGYYSCSPYGERLIAWAVTAGIGGLPSVNPAARFRASLYQPTLIKYLIPSGNLRLALAMASHYDHVQIVPTQIEDVLPPKVVITAPNVANEKPVTVKAAAEGSEKYPIVAMRLLVDGRPFQGVAGVKRFDKQQKAEATWDVALDAGAHTLSVLAETEASKGMSPSATITRAGAQKLPNLYVLAVGVSEYRGDMKLNYAASDALLLTNTMKAKSRSVFTNIEVKVLTDKQATKKNICEGLDWLHAKMTPRDVGFFFFSGHGGRDDKSDKFYLIPVDVGRDLSRTCLSGDELKRRLENMPGRLVAILDACHSGAVTEIKSARTDNLVRDLTTEDYGVVVLASSMGSESSMESSTTRAGYFTLSLTEGMNGRADFNKDGVVYLDELERYAAIRVPTLSSDEQHPTLGHPPSIRPFPISKP